MPKPIVAIVPYEKPRASVRLAIRQSQGLDGLTRGSKVFVKPNIVFWSATGPFPKWGVITTSRVVEDMVAALKDYGIDDITIGEGMVAHQRDRHAPAHAFEYLGYNRLKQRYGVQTLNVMERPFETVDLGDDFRLNFNRDVLAADFVVNLPVLKTHVQTVVSLGIKNLKGLIDMPSRKRCHNADPQSDLHTWVARLADRLPPMFTLIDGIYSNERGPGPDGHIHRTNVLIASRDVLAADLVGARVLGYEPQQVPHLAMAADNRQRSMDLSSVELTGTPIDRVCRSHAYGYEYDQATDGSWLPALLVAEGIQGVSYPKYDTSMCTYCSRVNGLTLAAIRSAWKARDGRPWDRIEILTGKRMQPTPGMHKTILIGQCMVKAHRKNPEIREMIPVKGCPPQPIDIYKALCQAGIEADREIFEKADDRPALLMKRYHHRPMFDETLFRIA
ncbi:conserved uncharacterized protein, DUF362 [Desulfosarcina variabilis str. Montpellier]|uniref:DUF362 domain-containing protein n=1 Tax=Desulfosarcina variabilis TaxID=2300 RepID=UPI003AFA445A